MTRFFTLLLLGILSVGCVRSPFYVAKEKRFTDTFWMGLSDQIVSSSELSTDGTNLYFGTGRGTIYALKVPNLKKIWSREVEGAVETAPLIVEKNLYIGTSQGRVYALNAESGVELWSQTISGELVGRPVLTPDQVLLIGANDGYLYALEGASGAIKWRYRKDLPDRITIHGFAAPVVLNSKIFAAFSDGTVATLRPEDGSELWNQKLSTDSRFPDVVAPLFASNDSIVAAQFYGSLFSIDPSGGVRWSVPKLGSPAAALPVETGLIVPASDSQIVFLDSKTGERKWTYQSPDSANWTGVAMFKGKLLAATGEGIVYVLTPEQGTLIWRYSVGSALKGAPLVIGDSVWMLTEKGAVIALRSR